jgi:hydroxymethylpyrimidine pyrophosphatase-like HAD family hydrolase/energy-coupling factor transporter ATP-binding protein EcfA2
MRYHALACDYDGTLALHGRVDSSTVAALERVRASGRKLFMVTGRQVEDLLGVFPEAHLFDRIVAENGAVVYDPGTREVRALADPPPPAFVDTLAARGVTPLAAGHVIVATWEPHGETVFQVIRDMGLELHVVFNKGAVMVLPSGVNKATGLQRALADLRLSPHNAVGIGDAENDHAFLSACEAGVAVANALDSVKADVDLVTAGDHGTGVVEMIDQLVDADLAGLAPRLVRHDLVIGRAEAGEDVRLPAHGGGVLIAGPSGAGKTTIATMLLERLREAEYQVCVVDPEGDYHELPGAIALRGNHETLAEQALRVLDRPADNVVVNLVDVRHDDRPSFFQNLLPRLLGLRAATGRPHWIIVDEAHHLLPASWRPADGVIPAGIGNVAFITVHADHVARAALDVVDTAIAVGRDAQATIDAWQRGSGAAGVHLPQHEPDHSSAWLVRHGAEPVRFRRFEPAADRLRHRRKYAEGELGEDRSFYFRGPDGRLNLRAQNLDLFIQLAGGVDDDTWLFHLRRGDVSEWFRSAIKDAALAREAAQVEADGELSAGDSRARIRKAIERRYTTPA